MIKIWVLAGCTFFFCALGLTGNAVSVSSLTQPSKFKHFITRQGEKLMEGDQEFRFAGANMPGLSLPYDYTLRFPDRLILPTLWEQANGLETAVRMNARVVRLWNLPMRGPDDDWMDWAYIQGPGQFNEEAFKTYDNLLALANQYGIRIIFSLGAEWGDYLGGIGEYAAWRGKERDAFYTDPQLTEDYKATLRYVINRRNTVTGQLYKDDKAILAWQFGNEMRNAPIEWEGEMADFIKSMDSNHLVMACNDSRVPENPPENLDILTRHYYRTDWEAEVRKDRAIAKRAKRPFIVGEYGLEKDVDLMRRFHEETLANGTSGSLIWSLYFHHRFGGFYWHQIFTDPAIGSFHWPGFASGAAHNERGMLETLREFGFRMEGLSVPPVSIPRIPKFLPMTKDLPFLTWRGSAGASGYDIYRAESEEGPWLNIAENVSDAQVAYRPLFNDTTAETGKDYFYRIAARNSSGASRLSHALGPVRFTTQVLVDEFHDFSRVHSHTDGLEIDNSYNGLYAEYLYRAKGDSGATVEYELPNDASRMRFWAFYAEDRNEPTVSVSSDGRTFAPVSLQENESIALKSFDKVKQLRGMQRTLVEHEAVLKDGSRYVRIGWKGPMELDRVEIEHGSN